jgi:hypothetical protein
MIGTGGRHSHEQYGRSMSKPCVQDTVVRMMTMDATLGLRDGSSRGYHGAGVRPRASNHVRWPSWLNVESGLEIGAFL